MQNKAKVWLKEQEMKELGLDVERERLKHYTVEEVEKWNQKLEQKKETEDKGFTDFAQISQKKYERQIRNFKQDSAVLKAVEEGKAVNTEKANLLEKVANDIRSEDARKNSAKRKFYNEDEDVTYINYKNEQFNKKLSRAYDKYTKDIKESLERGSNK